jgi:hypothetical protein
MAGHKDRVVKNSWMEDDVLVAAAVNAVEEGRPLPWNRRYRVNGSTWNDYKRAAAWVSREREKRRALTAGGLTSSRTQSSYLRTTKQNSSSRAAIALYEADAAKEAEKAEEDRLRKDGITSPSPYAGTKSLEERVGDWIKGFAFQIIGLIVLILLGILFGFGYGAGLIARVIAPIAFALGILILVFRFVRATATSLKSGKPVPKDWYK